MQFNTGNTTQDEILGLKENIMDSEQEMNQCLDYGDSLGAAAALNAIEGMKDELAQLQATLPSSTPCFDAFLETI